MASPPKSPANESVASSVSSEEDEEVARDATVTISDIDKPDQQQEHQDNTGHITNASPSPPPADIPPFDWEDFEARYENALQEANEEENEILKEAENLSKYFRAWASAASVHDDERAVKRLRTRQRFVNLSEEKMVQKQQHYEEVVRAFESALALLKST